MGSGIVLWGLRFEVSANFVRAKLVLSVLLARSFYVVILILV